ncbi:MAG: diguanylate cyclase domain-containing protein [Pseudomonadota bacterium]
MDTPNADLDRKRRIARRASLTSVPIWLAMALLQVFTIHFELSNISWRQSAPVFGGVLVLLILHDLYFRTPLCLKTGLKFSTVGAISIGIHVVLALTYLILDRFSYQFALLMAMVMSAGPAYLGLNFGFLPTLSYGFVLTGVLSVAYVLLPPLEKTLPAPVFFLFVGIVLVGWGVGAVVNGIHRRKKYRVVELLREQQLANDIIRDQKKRLDERTAELSRTHSSLHHMSLMDGLTQVANRRRFDEAMVEEWRRQHRVIQGREPSRQPADLEDLALILIDVDHFKPYNDRYGHPVGDECLRRVAQAINGAISRASDLVARYGGEEFVVLLPGTPSAGAGRVAERIRQAVEALAIPHGASPVSDHVTISLGVAATDQAPGATPEALIQAADVALYQAKQAGRNRSVVAVPTADGGRP